MKPFSWITVATLSLATGYATAQTESDPSPRTAPAPLSQAITSVGSNLANDPTNPGLSRAHEQLLHNQQRLATREGHAGSAAFGSATSSQARSGGGFSTAAGTGRSGRGGGGGGGGRGGGR